MSSVDEVKSIKKMVIKKPMVTTGRVITQKIGLIGAISYLISNIVGSGIFIAPTTILIQSRSVFIIFVFLLFFLFLLLFLM